MGKLKIKLDENGGPRNGDEHDAPWKARREERRSGSRMDFHRFRCVAWARKRRGGAARHTPPCGEWPTARAPCPRVLAPIRPASPLVFLMFPRPSPACICTVLQTMQSFKPRQRISHIFLPLKTQPNLHTTSQSTATSPPRSLRTPPSRRCLDLLQPPFSLSSHHMPNISSDTLRTASPCYPNHLAQEALPAKPSPNSRPHAIPLL